MTDIYSKEKRSRVMRAVRSSGTSIEIYVRKKIEHLGVDFQLNPAGLAGKPDIVFVDYNIVVFIHGCFWHGHNCKRGRNIPKSNEGYWRDKIAYNQMRDNANEQKLRKEGYRVIVMWECQMKDSVDRLIEELDTFRRSDNRRRGTCERSTGWDENRILPSHFRDARYSAGLTLWQVSIKTELSESTISKAERSWFSQRTMERLREFYAMLRFPETKCDS